MNDPSIHAPAASSEAARSPAHTPLHGVRIVDLSRHLPGPLTTRILADLGARVLKVEEPTHGDPTRLAPPMVDGTGSLARLLLAGHASVTLDLKQAASVEALGILLGDADVLVESFRPGTLARFGLDPTALRERFSRLIICSISGYGQQGPQAHRAGHDLTYQALAGTLAARPVAPAAQVADATGAWSAATAICAALVRRAASGRGCWIDQALTDAAAHAAVTGWAAEADGAKAVGEGLPLTGGAPCYDVYRTEDGGFFALAMLEPTFWQRFCAAVDRRIWSVRQYSNDPTFRRQVCDLMASRTREEWAALCAEHDLPGEPVLSMAEARAHPQNALRNVVRDAPDGSLRLTYPARFDGESPPSAGAASTLGADTEAVLAAHGIALPSVQSRGLRARVRRWLIGLGSRWLGGKKR